MVVGVWAIWRVEIDVNCPISTRFVQPKLVHRDRGRNIRRDGPHAKARDILNHILRSLF